MLLEKIKLETDEKVLKMVRKHWFVIVAELFGTFLAILIPFFIFFMLIVFSDWLTQFGITLRDYTTLIAFCTAAWILLALLSGFRIWTHYYLDLWVITDRRIISIDQIGFFNRQVSMFRLERMQDIAFDMKGFLPTLLNFGTLRANTAGHNEDNFHASSLPNPRELQAIIQGAMDERLKMLHVNPDALN